MRSSDRWKAECPTPTFRRPNVAESHIWLGLAADRDADHKAADHEFNQAFAELTAIGAQERLLKCHGIYAEVLERRGEMEKAYAHMKKAFAASRPGMLHTDEEGEETAALRISARRTPARQ